MPTSDREIASRAFQTPEWCAAADALFHATGVGVSVMDFGACDVLYAGNRCGYCHLATDISEISPVSCFDSCPDHDAGPGRLVCRAGMPTLYAPVMREDHAIAHVVLSGFVTSTRERRGLYEQLLTRDVKEDTARRSVRGVPVVPRRQAESYLQMAIASATTVVDATAERLVAADRIEELRLFVTAGHQVVSTDRLDAGALGGIVEEAVSLMGGEAGAILRPRGNLLEVTARSDGWRSALGALVPRASTAAGRAVETRRTVMTSGKEHGSSTLAMPLQLSDRVLGVLEIRMPKDAGATAQTRMVRLSRFAQFIAIALEREDERVAVERAMAGYAQLNGLAAALGGQTDMDGVAQLLASVIDKAFTFDLAGLVLSGWGRDRAEIVVSGDVSRDQVDHVLGIVAGRDVTADPFQDVRFVTHRGTIVDEAPKGDWAIATVSLRYGDLEVGSLFVARSDGEHYNAQDAALLDGIAAHGGAAFGRAALFSRIRDDYAKTIAALSATLDLGERSSAGHAGRVMEYAMLMGQELGLGHEAVERLRFAGLLHDVGKTGIPEDILLKPSKLTAEELEAVQRHAEIGASLVDQIDFLKSLTPVILHHHERWDGKGYPQRLKGEQIPLLARVLAVADAFDAMMTERAYAKRLTIAQARTELENGAGTQFDPRVVAALLEGLDRMALAGSTGLFAPLESLANPDLPA